MREDVSLFSIYSKVKSAVESKGRTSTAKSPSKEVKVIRCVNKVEEWRLTAVVDEQLDLQIVSVIGTF